MAQRERAVRRRVGRQVQRLRRSRGLSQAGLAELVGNTDKHVGQVERGEVNLTLDILTRIASALSVDICDLVARFPGRRRPEPPVFLVNGRELEQLEQIVRNIRSARTRSSDNAAD